MITKDINYYFMYEKFKDDAAMVLLLDTVYELKAQISTLKHQVDAIKWGHID